jgi:hypothetical protein
MITARKIIIAALVLGVVVFATYKVLKKEESCDPYDYKCKFDKTINHWFPSYEDERTIRTRPRKYKEEKKEWKGFNNSNNGIEFNIE